MLSRSSLILLASLLVNVSAIARESTAAIAMNVAQKQAMLEKLNASIVRHQQMSLVEIKAELANQVRRNEAHVLKIGKDSKVSSDGVHKNVSRTLDALNRAQSKKALIAMEVEIRDRLETSANFTFLFLQEAAANNPTGQLHGTEYIWMGFYALLDVATLPITLVLSALTGF